MDEYFNFSNKSELIPSWLLFFTVSYTIVFPFSRNLSCIVRDNNFSANVKSIFARWAVGQFFPAPIHARTSTIQLRINQFRVCERFC